MGVHQLRYFAAAAEQRNFSRAAERMRVAQPSFSQQIQKLLHETHCLSRQIKRWCGRHGICPRAALPTVQLSTIVAMVAAGLGISLLPKMAVAHEQNRGCVFIPLGAAAPGRELNLLRNPARHRSKAAAAFAKVARTISSA